MFLALVGQAAPAPRGGGWAGPLARLLSHFVDFEGDGPLYLLEALGTILLAGLLGWGLGWLVGASSRSRRTRLRRLR